MEHELTTLGEYAKVQGGYAFKSKDFIDSANNKVLKIKNVRFGTIDYSECAYVSDEIARATSAWKTNEGDILISMTGSGPNAPQSLVGRVARVWKGEPSSLINQRVGRIQIKDEKIIHTDFVFYLLSLPQSQDFLVANSSGSANQANISGKIIELLPCPKITYEKSAEIAKIIRSLDEKVILNQQTNQTLEQMAQALFKSWFVDFDPVIDNAIAAGNTIPDELQARAEVRKKAIAERATNPKLKPLPENIQQLFPNEFEHCGDHSAGIFGFIPKGWKNGTLQSVAKYSTSRIDCGKLTEENYISTENMLAYKKGITKASSLPKVNTTPSFLPGQILVSNIRPYFQKIWLASFQGGRSNDVLGFETLVGNTETYLMCLLSQDSFFKYMMATSKGSKMPRGDKKAIMEWPVAVPPTPLIMSFSDLVRDFYNRKTASDIEIKSLIVLRDTLLPKLISGEIMI